MLSDLAKDFLGELIVKPILELVCYGTGRQIVRLVSFGRWDARIPTSSAKSKPYKLLSTAKNGRRYLDANVVVLIGLLWWASVVAVGVSWYLSHS